MSLKPICVNCQCFYKPKKTGFDFLEGQPTVDAAPRGRRSPEKWKPYKLWSGDLWECPDCGHEIIVGTGREAFAEHFEPGFDNVVEKLGVTLQVNDC